jgi:hypothetical protein
MTVETILKAIHNLPSDERAHLIHTIIEIFGDARESQEGERTRRLSELRGLGKEIWQNVDTQEYINRLRDDWDERL